MTTDSPISSILESLIPKEVIPPQQEETLKLIEDIRTICKKDYFFFAKFILGYKDLIYEIHGPICQVLQQPHKDIRILLPRGWFKTTIVSIGYPIWEAIRDPNTTTLITQNTYKNACAKLKSIREQIETNQLLRFFFPELIPTESCKWTEDSLHIPRSLVVPEGTFDAAGVRTQVTSRHYDRIIEDDTVAPDYDELGEESVAPSKEDIDLAIGWHRLIGPLFRDPNTGRSIVVGTRWFEKDLHSWIEQNQPYYVSYCRACREDENGNPDPKGAITFPQRFNEEILAKLQFTLGLYMFSCLYLNTPISSANQTFRKEDILFFESLPNGQYQVVCTVDLAGNPNVVKSKDSDFNVVLTSAKNLKTGKIYILRYWRKRALPSEVIDEILLQWELFHFQTLGIETVGYQSVFLYCYSEAIQKKRIDTSKFDYELRTINNTRNKELRIKGLQPLFQAKKIFLLYNMSELIDELVSFPYAAHDDILDNLAMQQQLWFPTQEETEKEKLLKVVEENPFSFEHAKLSIENRFRIKVGGLYEIYEGNSKEELIQRQEEFAVESANDLLNPRSSLFRSVTPPEDNSWIDDYFIGKELLDE